MIDRRTDRTLTGGEFQHLPRIGEAVISFEGEGTYAIYRVVDVQHMPGQAHPRILVEYEGKGPVGMGL